MSNRKIGEGLYFVFLSIFKNLLINRLVLIKAVSCHWRSAEAQKVLNAGLWCSVEESSSNLRCTSQIQVFYCLLSTERSVAPCSAAKD